MIRTFGLTHTAHVVADLERSVAFYKALLGVEILHPLPPEDWRQSKGVDVGTPGCHDVISLQPADGGATGEMGNLGHIGFRLQAPDDVDQIARAVEAAGGTVSEKGHFRPGMPYVFAKDPDGYVIEIWFEPEHQGVRDRASGSA